MGEDGGAACDRAAPLAAGARPAVFLVVPEPFLGLSIMVLPPKASVYTGDPLVT
jgi:hypothetical protein